MAPIPADVAFVESLLYLAPDELVIPPPIVCDDPVISIIQGNVLFYLYSVRTF
jgi:hypothetical protein